MHGTLAERAGLPVWLDPNLHSGENRKLTLISILQGLDLLLQERERGEREGAVFFSS